MKVDAFFDNPDYNRCGPETCLSDEDFLTIWAYYQENCLPECEYKDILIDVLGFLASCEKLPDCALLTDKESVKNYLAGDDDSATAAALLSDARCGIVFNCCGWIAARFYNPQGTEYERFHYCFEDIKYILKTIAKQDELLR